MASECTEKEFFNLKKKLMELQMELGQSEENTTRLMQDNAKLGNELRDKNKEADSLEQRSYSLNMKLSSTELTLQCCTAELEGLQDDMDKQKDTITKRLTQEHMSQIRVLKNKVLECQQSMDDAVADGERTKEQLVLSQRQLVEAQQALNDVSICEEIRDDTNLNSQIATLTCDKQELATLLCTAAAERDALGEQLERAQRSVLEMKEQLEEDQCRSTSYYNQVERLKEDLLEHQQELDLYKMNEKDITVKGNSVFAEVEDHRVYLEEQMIKLQAYYKTVIQQYELKVRQVARLKSQVASLLSLSSTRADSEYVEHLNSSLRLARYQIGNLKEQVREMDCRIKLGSERPLVIQCPPTGCTSRSPYFQKTFEANQREMVEVKKTLQNARFHSTVLSDEILTLQRKLHQADRDEHEGRAAYLRLRMQLDEVRDQKGIFTEIRTQETRLEILHDRGDGKGATKCDGMKKEPPRPAGSEVEDTCKQTDRLSEKQEEVASCSHCNTLATKRKFCEDDDRPLEDKTCKGKDGSVANKENCAPQAAPSSVATAACEAVEDGASNKKHRKCVRMQETVDVQSSDGARTEETLKSTDGSGVKLRKTLRKLEPQPPQMVLPEGISDCKQQ